MSNTASIFVILGAGVALGWLGPKMVDRFAMEPDVVSRGAAGDLTGAIDPLPVAILDAPREDLSEVQSALIAKFERTARELNETDGHSVRDNITFNNMVIDRLDVRYYYTITEPYDKIDRAAFFAKEGPLVQSTLCDSETLRALISEYGFEYTYVYLSEDSRMVGRIEGSLAGCGA